MSMKVRVPLPSVFLVLKSKADIQGEKAESMKAYRVSLAKYQDDVAKAKELSRTYMQSLREIEVKQSHPRRSGVTTRKDWP